jgi:hypothetical protein
MGKISLSHLMVGVLFLNFDFEFLHEHLTKYKIPLRLVLVEPEEVFFYENRN